jgi:hypothetical protein
MHGTQPPTSVLSLLLLLLSIVQVCGQGPAATPEQLAAALFEGEAASQSETLQGMFRACSYGNADFSRDVGAEVVSATVPIDCTGKTPWGAPYDSMTCPYTGRGVSDLTAYIRLA